MCGRGTWASGQRHDCEWLVVQSMADAVRVAHSRNQHMKASQPNSTHQVDRAAHVDVDEVAVDGVIEQLHAARD